MKNKVFEIADTYVKKIIECSDPVKIILFGSAAKGSMGKYSDFDFLVVMKNGSERRKTAHKIYKNIREIDYSADIIVVTEEDVDTYKDSEWNVINPALREGKILYAA